MDKETRTDIYNSLQSSIKHLYKHLQEISDKVQLAKNDLHIISSHIYYLENEGVYEETEKINKELTEKINKELAKCKSVC